MTQRPPIPRGIEILLKKAAASPPFRTRLLSDPAAAAAEIDLELTATERSVLEQTSKERLERMIDAAAVAAASQHDAAGEADAAAIRAMLPPLARPSPDSYPPPAGIPPDRPEPRPTPPTPAPAPIPDEERVVDPEPHRRLVTGIAPDRPRRPWWKRLLGR